MQTDSHGVDWEQIKLCLAEVNRTSADFLRQALLIGGAACWFYRRQLRKANDPDFRIKLLTPADENRWLSRDLDFTGIFSEDAFKILPHHVVVQHGRKHLEMAGVRLGFAQVGVTIDPEEAISFARVGSVEVEGRTIEFLIADPLTRYYEKCKLCQM